MANDDDARSASPEDSRPRPGPTIDLKATEVAREKPPESRPDPAEAGDGAGAAPPESEAGPAQDFPPQAEAAAARRPAALWITIAALAVGLPLLGAGLWFGGAFGPPMVAPDNAAQAQLAARLDAIEAALARRPAPAPTPPAPAHGADAAALTELNRRLDDIAQTARQALTRADAATAAADRAQRAPAADNAGASSAALDALTGRVAALEQALRDLSTNRPEADDRAGRLAIAASALRNAIERGATFTAELAAAKALGADAAALAPVERFAEKGVPTVPALARELATLAPAMLRVIGEQKPSGNVLEKLQASAERLVRIRPAGEVSGDDPVSVIARIELKAARADIQGALQDLKRLPDNVRAPAQSWIATVEARETAVAAGRRFADEVLAALGKATR